MTILSTCVVTTTNIQYNNNRHKPIIISPDYMHIYIYIYVSNICMDVVAYKYKVYIYTYI